VVHDCLAHGFARWSVATSARLGQLLSIFDPAMRSSLGEPERGCACQAAPFRVMCRLASKDHGPGMPPEFDHELLGRYTVGRRQRHDQSRRERPGFARWPARSSTHGGRSVFDARLDVGNGVPLHHPNFEPRIWTKGHALSVLRIAALLCPTGEDDPQRMITAVWRPQSAVLFFRRWGRRWSRHGG